MKSTEARQGALAELPGWDAARLATRLVVLCGGGALAAEVARQLALVGVGRVVIADDGCIAREDLAAGGLYCQEDLGQRRALVMARRLLGVEPAMRVHPVLEGPLVLGTGVFWAADLVIAGDLGPRAGFMIDRWCARAGVPWIEATSGVFHGSYRVFHAIDGACMACELTEVQRKALTSLGAAPPQPVLTTPPAVAVLAGLVAQSALALLCPREGMPPATGRETFYNGRSDGLSVRDLQRRADCHHPDPAVVLRGPWSRDTHLGELLEVAREALGPEAIIRPDRPVAWRLRCVRCGGSHAAFRSAILLREEDLVCPACGFLRAPDLLREVSVRTPFLTLPVSRTGLPPYPLLHAVSRRGSVYLELGGDRVLALGSAA